MRLTIYSKYLEVREMLFSLAYRSSHLYTYMYIYMHEGSTETAESDCFSVSKQIIGINDSCNSTIF